MADLFGRQIMELDAWREAARKGSAPSDVALLKGFSGAIEIAEKATEGESAAPIRIRITTGARDRDRDSINPGGWRLDNYRKNPVVLFAHNYRALPVARDVGLTIDERGLVGTPEFCSEEYDFARLVERLIRRKVLNAASIGMLPLKWSINEEARGFDFEEQELLEYSIVPVPANPEALRVASAEGIDLSPLKSWVTELLDGWGDDAVSVIPKAVAERVRKIAAGDPVTVHVPALVTERLDAIEAAVKRIEAAATKSATTDTTSGGTSATSTEAKTGEAVVLTLADEPTYAIDLDDLTARITASVQETVGAFRTATTGRLD
jgi:HK97 family phage prohead protease